MAFDEKLARWAALFIRAQDDAGIDATPAPPASAGAPYPGVTEAAAELLRAVDAGGVPAFVTSNLKQIARDNGVDAPDGWTPNQIIEAIRSRVQGEPGAGDG